jgi:hypothetical protein
MDRIREDGRLGKNDAEKIKNFIARMEVAV